MVVGRTVIYDQVRIIHDDLGIGGPPASTLLLIQALALEAETGCVWAPWLGNWSGSFCCLHGLMVTSAVPRRILEGDEMPGVADWLRRQHAGQIALKHGGARPQGHNEPYRPARDEELPSW